MRINIRKTLLLILTIIFMFVGNLVTMNIHFDSDQIANKWLFVLIASLIILSIMKNNFFIINRKALLFLALWQMFIIFIFLSKLVNGDGEFLIFEFLLYSLLIPITFFDKNIIKYKNIFLFSFIISIIPFVYFFGTINNNLGILFSIGGIVLLNLLRIKNVNDKYIYLSILLFLILIYSIQSRTALLTFSLVAILHIYLIIKKKSTNYIVLIRKLVTVFLVFVFIIYSYDYAVNLLFNKWGPTTQDLTSGRADIWLTTIKSGITYFGNGEDYYTIFYNLRDSHNIFIQVLGTYGIISFIFFLLIFLYIMIKSFMTRNIEYIFFFVGFFVLGLAENLFFINSRLIGVHLLFFTYLGCLINEKTKFK